MRSFSKLWAALGGTGQDTGIPPSATLIGPQVMFDAAKALAMNYATNTATRSGIGAAADIATLTITTPGWYLLAWHAALELLASGFVGITFAIRGDQNSVAIFMQRYVLVAGIRNASLQLSTPLYLRTGDAVVGILSTATIAGDSLLMGVNSILLYQE